MRNKLIFSIVLIFPILFLYACQNNHSLAVKSTSNDLDFPSLAKTWDEGMPLGNSEVGALVWGKDSCLRMSLDRVDLWDERPMDSISGANNTFQWVYDHVKSNNYKPVQDKFDVPYDALPAPSKIPGAALEFNLRKMGQARRVHLYLDNAVCEVDWKNGAKLQTYVHANKPIGWFIFENAPNAVLDDSSFVQLIAPKYTGEGNIKDMGPVEGQDLRRLGYEKGTEVHAKNQIIYHQKGWGDFSYDVVVQWKRKGSTLLGAWSISSSKSQNSAMQEVSEAMKRGIHLDYNTHLAFWNKFWGQSSIAIPDTILTKQYANEVYKMGSTARENSHPISLQSVWTADNGKLPPWKGDYHNDLNTQLSYWPFYTGNHLTQAMGYLNTLWDQREINKKYTKQYFGVDGLDVPGVTTLDGVPMGGWIQYSMSPTVSSWLAQHFYLQYKYSGDQVFLKDRVYPYFKDVATFLENFSIVGKDGIRKLPLSYSPEINDNSINAWFKTMTNYDLALVHNTFEKAAELAGDLNLKEEVSHWKKIDAEFGDYDLDETGGLTFAKGHPYHVSHRHFSNSMAIHPLGLIDWSNGAHDQKIIKATIANLEKQGPSQWCGYSYAWFGNLKARAMDGEGAAEALRIFAQCFCLKNTFHANGDQSGSGKSSFTYRPFTLEGNFAFAAGVQEMLIQSHTGIIRIFPAIPSSWTNVSFNQLRTFGAFLVSAEQKNGKVIQVKVVSEQGGLLRIHNPFVDTTFKVTGNTNAMKMVDNTIELYTTAGQVIYFCELNYEADGEADHIFGEAYVM